jgi:acyl carrier protein phosphodiesterase
MNEMQVKKLIDQIFVGIFDNKFDHDLDSFMKKFAFDIKLPVMVYDSTTGEETWAESYNSTRFITFNNEEAREDWMLPKRNIESIDDIIEIWRETNLTTTERNFNSINTAQSDTIYDSENV